MKSKCLSLTLIGLLLINLYFIHISAEIGSTYPQSGMSSTTTNDIFKGFFYGKTNNSTVTQSSTVWRYQYAAANNFSTEAYNDLTWRDATPKLQISSSTGYPCVYSNDYTLQPGDNDLAIVFTAPESGLIEINNVYSNTLQREIRTTDTTDGVKAKILKNTDTIWPTDTSLSYYSNGWAWVKGGSSVSQPLLYQNVEAGDKIIFRLNKNMNGNNDGSYWNPTVKYVSGITFSKVKYYVGENMTASLAANVIPGFSGTVEYTSNNTNVLTIDQDGDAFGVYPGTTTVLAELKQDGVTIASASATVTVETPNGEAPANVFTYKPQHIQGPYWFYKYAPAGNISSSSFVNMALQTVEDGASSFDRFNVGGGASSIPYFRLDQTIWFPGNNYDAVIAFRAPRSGYMKITGTPFNVATAYDGIKFRVAKNDTRLSPLSEGESDWYAIKDSWSESQAMSLFTDVAEGDYIYFQMNKNITQDGDECKWAPQVEYVEAIYFNNPKIYVPFDGTQYDTSLTAFSIPLDNTIVQYRSDNPSILSVKDSSDGIFTVKGTGSTRIYADMVQNSAVIKTAYTDIVIKSHGPFDGLTEYPATPNPFQGPIWYWQYATPLDSETVTYNNLSLATASGTISYDRFTDVSLDDYKYGRVRLDSTDKVMFHTGKSGDITLTFVAPRSGYVSISSEYGPMIYSKDGIKYRIRKNDETIYPFTGGWQVVEANVSGIHRPFLQYLNQGDKLYFTIDKNGIIDGDEGTWKPVVTYVDNEYLSDYLFGWDDSVTVNYKILPENGIDTAEVIGVLKNTNDEIIDIATKSQSITSSGYNDCNFSFKVPSLQSYASKIKFEVYIFDNFENLKPLKPKFVSYFDTSDTNHWLPAEKKEYLESSFIGEDNTVSVAYRLKPSFSDDTATAVAVLTDSQNNVVASQIKSENLQNDVFSDIAYCFNLQDPFSYKDLYFNIYLLNDTSELLLDSNNMPTISNLNSIQLLKDKYSLEISRNVLASAWNRTYTRTGVDNVKYHSASMDTDVNVMIKLPDEYADNPGKSYPVFYYLHAKGSTCAEVYDGIYNAIDAGVHRGDIPPMIIVAVNGANNSWYMDTLDIYSKARTSFLNELIPFVEANYRTINGKQGRIISGFSMGGFGSTSIAFEHPDMFAGVITFGAAVYNTDDFIARWTEDFTDVLDSRRSIVDKYNPFAMINKNYQSIIDNNLKIAMFIGSNDFTLPFNNSLSAALTEKSIPHQLIPSGTAGHNMDQYTEKVGVQVVDTIKNMLSSE